jgi:hypothetical protein
LSALEARLLKLLRTRTVARREIKTTATRIGVR